MDQAAMIPVVRWIRNGYASELPVRIELPDVGEEEPARADLMNLEHYDDEDSKPNQRPPNICV